ncbi:MAG: hypothetical protein P9M15_01770 [Candidatus Electryoneaceae bacterium]|nr:hypothetical protein [Candidatus Electryoneaceae bacterium]
MNTGNKLIRLTNKLREACSKAARSEEFNSADKLQSFGRLFGLSEDSFNNRLYGRVDLDDSFITEVFRVIREQTPDIAEQFLREYFLDQTIRISPEPVIPLNNEQMQILVFRAMNRLGKLADDHANHMSDGLLSVSEKETEIGHAEILIEMLKRYVAGLHLSLDNETSRNTQ